MKETQRVTFNHLLAAAEIGYEPGINLMMKDIITDPLTRIRLSEKILNNLKDHISVNRVTGFVCFFLGELQDYEDTPKGVIQNWYRKSMECGFILGKIRFAEIQYKGGFYSVALRHFLEILGKSTNLPHLF